MVVFVKFGFRIVCLPLLTYPLHALSVFWGSLVGSRSAIAKCSAPDRCLASQRFSVDGHAGTSSLFGTVSRPSCHYLRCLLTVLQDELASFLTTRGVVQQMVNAHQLAGHLIKSCRSLLA
eukprot:GHVT01053147.1.p1 GENE.GHVT01053147.1~~GHVT01053147.1.p1  ORF type:complete len:120 (-),score=11.49 GHVT01053147.1:1470-1829(-)